MSRLLIYGYNRHLLKREGRAVDADLILTHSADFSVTRRNASEIVAGCGIADDRGESAQRRHRGQNQVAIKSKVSPILLESTPFSD